MTDFVPVHDTPAINRFVALRRRPRGIPLAADFEIRRSPVPDPGPDRFLVRNLYLSVDPVQRGWAANELLTPLGTPMRALAVGIVQESRNTAISAGDIVYGFFGWQDYAIAHDSDLLSHRPQPQAPVSAYAGVLGMPGVTALLALHNLAPPGPGDGILISTAAGAVGSVVGQIAHRSGALVVGLTGSADKAARCTSRFGYDKAFNYKTSDLAQIFSEIRPAGFQIYFDNTGGTILDHAIRAMAKYGRIVQCGTAATAIWTPPPTGWRNEREILTRVLTWSGFNIFDHVAHFATAVDRLTDLMLAGGLEHDEDIAVGIESAPCALESLFAGENTGKKLIFVGHSGET